MQAAAEEAAAREAAEEAGKEPVPCKIYQRLKIENTLQEMHAALQWGMKTQPSSHFHQVFEDAKEDLMCSANRSQAYILGREKKLLDRIDFMNERHAHERALREGLEKKLKALEGSHAVSAQDQQDSSPS